MEILLSVQFRICDEKCKYLERMKEIAQMNYIRADIDFLKLGAKGSWYYFYQAMIIKAVQEPTIMTIIIIMMLKTRMIIWTIHTRLTLQFTPTRLKRCINLIFDLTL